MYTVMSVYIYVHTYVIQTNKEGAIYFSDNLCIAGSIQGFQGYLLSKGNF